jgi:hypothetical protein
MKPGVLVSLFFPIGAALATGGGREVAFAAPKNEGRWALPFYGV